MRRARQRGSVCLYVAVVLVSLGMLTAAVVPLATGYGTRTTRRNDELRARLAFEAGVARVKSQGLLFANVAGSPTTVAVNGASGTVTPNSNDAGLSGSLLLTGTIVRNGGSYRYSRVVGPHPPTPFHFALFCGTDYDDASLNAGSGGASGDMYVVGKLNGHATTGMVNGNLFATKTISSSGTVTGRTVPNATSIDFPNPNSSDYQSEALSLLTSGRGLVVLTNTTLNSLTFLTVTDGVYPIYYYANDLTLGGTISGRGTVYVKGTLRINDDLRYASSSDEVAFVCKGRVEIGPGVTAVDGFYYAGDRFALGNKGLTVSRGGIVTKNMDMPQTLTITRDDAVRNDNAEGTRLRLPAHWPL